MVAADRQRGFVCIAGRPFPITSMVFRHQALEISCSAVGPLPGCHVEFGTVHDSDGRYVTEIHPPLGITVPPVDERSMASIVLPVRFIDDMERAPHTA
jgi:hypothetical protein